MNRRRAWPINVLVITAVWLFACILPLGARVPASPSRGAVETIIAQTAKLAQTQTASAMPSSTPTSTPTRTPSITPTLTPTLAPILLPVFGTQTVIVGLTENTSNSSIINTSEDSSSTDDETTATKSPISHEWACLILEKSPANNAVMSKGENFYASWLIKNTGTKFWPQDGVDVVFRSGLRPEGRAIFDLPSTVSSGSSIAIEVQLTAPKKEGAYNSRWNLRVGRTSFCAMNVYIEVR